MKDVVREAIADYLAQSRDVLQAARADAVGALLVLLDLLEGDAQILAEFFLAHAKHHAAQAHPAVSVEARRLQHVRNL